MNCVLESLICHDDYFLLLFFILIHLIGQPQPE
jgi:hypothetical protein